MRTHSTHTGAQSGCNSDGSSTCAASTTYCDPPRPPPALSGPPLVHGWLPGPGPRAAPCPGPPVLVQQGQGGEAVRSTPPPRASCRPASHPRSGRRWGTTAPHDRTERRGPTGQRTCRHQRTGTGVTGRGGGWTKGEDEGTGKQCECALRLYGCNHDPHESLSPSPSTPPNHQPTYMHACPLLKVHCNNMPKCALVPPPQPTPAQSYTTPRPPGAAPYLPLPVPLGVHHIPRVVPIRTS